MRLRREGVAGCGVIEVRMDARGELLDQEGDDGGHDGCMRSEGSPRRLEEARERLHTSEGVKDERVEHRKQQAVGRSAPLGSRRLEAPVL